MAAIKFAASSTAKSDFSNQDSIAFNAMPIGRVFFDCREGFDLTATVKSADRLPNSAWYILVASAANALTSEGYQNAEDAAKRCFVELARRGGWSVSVDTDHSRMTCSMAGESTEIVIRRLPKT